MESAKNSNEVKWINVAKFLAIAAVLTDHTKGILYTDPRISTASYFSVTLFIFLSGMTTFLSSERTGQKITKEIVAGRCRKILIPYAVAVFLYMAVSFHKFDLMEYLDYLVHFNITGVHYFVLLYLQMLLISPVLHRIILWAEQRSWKVQSCFHLAASVFLLYFASWSIRRTNLMDVYGGGGKLLGGTYLVVFYWGLLAGSGVLKGKLKGGKIIPFALSALAWLVWWMLICKKDFFLDRVLSWGNGFNPPGPTLIVFSLITAYLFMSGVTLAETYANKFTDAVLNLLNELGKHTMYIFLYHWLFISVFLNEYCTELNIWLKRIVYFTVMIGGSLFVEFLLKKIREFLSES